MDLQEACFICDQSFADLGRIYIGPDEIGPDLPRSAQDVDHICPDWQDMIGSDQKYNNVVGFYVRPDLPRSWQNLQDVCYQICPDRGRMFIGSGNI